MLADPELRDQVCPRAETDTPGSEYEGSGYSDGSWGSPCSDCVSRSQASDGNLAFPICGPLKFSLEASGGLLVLTPASEEMAEAGHSEEATPFYVCVF